MYRYGDFSPMHMMIGAVLFVVAFAVCLLIWKAIERERKTLGTLGDSVEERYRAVAQNIRDMHDAAVAKKQRRTDGQIDSGPS